MSFCARCGAKCEGTNFCTQCGERINVAPTPSNTNVSYSFTAEWQQIKNPGGAVAVDAPEIPGFGGAVQTCVLKYFSVKGRASRSEFWYWILFQLLVIGGFATLLLHLESVCDLGFINHSEQQTLLAMSFVCAGAFVLSAVIPTFTAFIRRLHDSNASFRSFLGSFGLLLVGIGLTVVAAVSGAGVIFIGAIVCGAIGLLRFIFLLFRCGTRGANQFGLEPVKRNRNKALSSRNADGTEASEQQNPDAPDIPGFWGAIATCFKKYFSFSERASRPEFWNWIVWLFITFSVWNALPILLSIFAYGSWDVQKILVWAQYCLALVVTLPTLSVSVRRLHDVGKSEWIMTIPCVVGLLLFFTGNPVVPTLVFAVALIWFLSVCCRPGTRGENQYGSEPQKKVARAKSDLAA